MSSKVLDLSMSLALATRHVHLSLDGHPEPNGTHSFPVFYTSATIWVWKSRGRIKGRLLALPLCNGFMRRRPEELCWVVLFEDTGAITCLPFFVLSHFFFLCFLSPFIPSHPFLSTARFLCHATVHSLLPALISSRPPSSSQVSPCTFLHFIWSSLILRFFHL